MSYLEELDVLFQKRIDALQKKKQRCMDYSSMPNRCVNKVEAQIARVKKLARVARFRKRALESESLIDAYLDTIQEGKPKSPVARVATGVVAAAGLYKGAKWKIMRDRCKDKKYSPYLYKRCMKGLEESLREAEGWEGMPKGWKQSSLKKFSKSLTGKKATEKGFFDKCVKRMRGKLDNPEAFCASIKDERHGSTFWRGKGKTPQQAGKDVKRMQNVKRG